MKRESWEQDLSAIRDDIDLLDDKLLSLIEERMSLVTKIGLIKKQHHLTSLDQTREIKIKQHLEEMIEDKSKSNYIIPIFETIMATSKAFQSNEIIREDRKNDSN